MDQKAIIVEEAELRKVLGEHAYTSLYKQLDITRNPV
jgi:hypothetical protein